jgi:fructose-specific phosphotransferase system IIA component
MAKIADKINLECISLELSARRKEDAISDLVNLLAQAGEIADSKAVYKAVLEREEMVSTGVGEGVAMPHARIAGIERSVIAFGRKKSGLSFDALDGKPVKLVFLLISPKSNEGEQLILLSTLARLLRSRSVRKGLLSATTPEEVVDALERKKT